MLNLDGLMNREKTTHIILYKPSLPAVHAMLATCNVAVLDGEREPKLLIISTIMHAVQS